jgi:hypothetical protein
MRTLTIRLSEELVVEIEAESQRRGLSKSDIVRERLTREPRRSRERASFDLIADLVGSVDRLPGDRLAGKKRRLKALGYGRKRPG